MLLFGDLNAFGFCFIHYEWLFFSPLLYCVCSCSQYKCAGI